MRQSNSSLNPNSTRTTIMFESNSEVPRWLSALLTEKFFSACIIHEDEKRNEKNVFCFDCCDDICHHCLTHHRSHRLLQIRRYVYNDVIKLVDAETLLDCAQVQTYTSNGSKVVFLKEKYQTKPARGVSGVYCITCDRNIQDSNLFCSLSCKLQEIIRTGKKVSIYLRRCEFPALFEPGLVDDGQMTPDSVLEPAGSMRTESCSSSGGPAAFSECLALATTATTAAVRKKRSNSAGTRSVFRPVSRICHYSETTMNRRKGTPQRSPLF